jgi:hypothetical protein
MKNSLISQSCGLSSVPEDLAEKALKLTREVSFEMKKKFPIITSKSYLKTFLSSDFHFKCHPYLFLCVDKHGKISIPCFDSPHTKLYDIIKDHNLKELMLSDDTSRAREAVKGCNSCYMHCIVEPSKVLGEPLHTSGISLNG